VADPQDDPGIVRREYADETGLNVRFALWERRDGPQPGDIAFDEIVALEPSRVLEVGCGRGELAARLVGAGIEVVALDQSPRMVELTRERGVDARVGDVQELEFPDASFDVAVANHMLYHVPDIDRALGELARVLCPGGTLVASTNGARSLVEMWDLVGRDLSERNRLFMRETGEAMLRRHFREVRVIPIDGTFEMTADEMRTYVAHSVAHKHLAGRVPDFAGTRSVTASSAVFVAKT
jgi:ubiquinone/menaquinone biosynthesis C-methylase UbiE